MIEIIAPASGIKKVCGEQKIEDTEYRFSRHAVRVTVEEGILVFQTMTGELVFFSDADDEQRNIDYLIRHWFMVPQSFDENRYVDQLRRIVQMLDKKKRFINSFTVFSTTDCNARCSYCYELGRKRLHMTDAVAADAAEFIAKVSDGKDVKISWFGGEPLYNQKAIDLICSALTKNKVDFKCSMVSNGYLFDAEVIKKAATEWNLKSVQITLDGTKEKYNRIKAYIYHDDSAYDRVLDNIDNALKAGIEVSVRLNVDAGNQADIKELIRQLGERFYGRERFGVYHKMLVPFAGKIQDFENDESRTDCYFEIWDLLCSYGFCIENNLKNDFYIQQCMADNDSTVTILPDGKLGKCEHFSESETIGDIMQGITDQETVESWKETVQYPLCAECALYPRCIHLKKCDWNRIVCDGSDREIRLERVKRTMLTAYRNNTAEREN